MAAPNEKLAASLTALRDLQKSGRHVFQSQELSRIDRERLLQNGFVQEVMKGVDAAAGRFLRWNSIHSCTASSS
jgi:hypothetical protein